MFCLYDCAPRTRNRRKRSYVQAENQRRKSSARTGFSPTTTIDCTSIPLLPSWRGERSLNQTPKMSTTFPTLLNIFVYGLLNLPIDKSRGQPTARLLQRTSRQVFTHSKMATEALPYVHTGDTKRLRQTYYLPTHEARIIIHAHMETADTGQAASKKNIMGLECYTFTESDTCRKG